MAQYFLSDHDEHRSFGYFKLDLSKRMTQRARGSWIVIRFNRLEKTFNNDVEQQTKGIITEGKKIVFLRFSEK